VSGSAYTYTYATLGELVAWMIGWDLVLEYALGAATVARELVRATSSASSTSLAIIRPGAEAQRRERWVAVASGQSGGGGVQPAGSGPSRAGHRIAGRGD
jgi:amino acid transporter